MSTEEMLAELHALVMKFPEGKIIFAEPVEMKRSPHQHLFTCFGISTDPFHGTWLLHGGNDGHGQWDEILPAQVNAELVISSVLQRVRYISSKKTSINSLTTTNIF